MELGDEGTPLRLGSGAYSSGGSDTKRKHPQPELIAGRLVVVTTIWAVFLLIGTVFYAYYEDYGWSKGHYYAVNVGLNIGWNWSLEESDGSKVFSILYLLLGYFLISCFVVFVGDMVISRAGRLDGETNKNDSEVGGQLSIILQIVAAWLLYVSVGVIWSTQLLGWSVLDGFYFSLSSLSAGGMYSIPDGTDDYVYGVAGIYTAIGIPLMVLTFGLLASWLLFPIILGSKLEIHEN